MDPYLEDPGLWPDVHHRLISVASDLLQDRVSPKYIVRVEERVYVSAPDDESELQRVADAQVVLAPRHSGGVLKPVVSGAVAELDRPQPIEVPVEDREPVREARLNIMSRDDRSVVAVIEVVSPTNKAVGGAGRANYLQKREEVMDSNSHLVEIDLLRSGVPVFARSWLPAHDYAVRVSKRISDMHRRGWVWPIRIQQQLPEIFIPLLKGDSDALLDLQAVLATVYKRASYELELDYRRPPAPPLQGDRAAWAADLLARSRS
jgi:hypothetical protein